MLVCLAGCENLVVGDNGYYVLIAITAILFYFVSDGLYIRP